MKIHIAFVEMDKTTKKHGDFYAVQVVCLSFDELAAYCDAQLETLPPIIEQDKHLTENQLIDFLRGMGTGSADGVPPLAFAVMGNTDDVGGIPMTQRLNGIREAVKMLNDWDCMRSVVSNENRTNYFVNDYLAKNRIVLIQHDFYPDDVPNRDFYYSYQAMTALLYFVVFGVSNKRRNDGFIIIPKAFARYPMVHTVPLFQAIEEGDRALRGSAGKGATA